ncbi:MBL fold metallo-hydrolase [Marinilongibacter aquaticus]|uniref:MBL fold metallo-hydrolase RNA specificity domain-containing protein n=1 Tax=Marinilongibacter aquaticus TaxID=2975157 RepID=UPI0021BD5612|nr:MBL fold metallo-hydrolase [Marinilongibacter aquaticus]UBM57743.1 MBL fold metallo-hydrolase [Marinilongibacter aquaticus]
MRVQFYGAAQRVTGSKHLLTSQYGTKVLLDCGLFQGIGTTELNQEFGFSAREVNHVILSHAHIDHSGLLPRLVRQGFNGTIFCTPATKSLCEIMLLDSARIQESDLKWVNQRRKKRGEELIDPLYEEEDAQKALDLMQTVGYHKPYEIEEGFHFSFYEAGHILGSAGVFVEFEEKQERKTLFFTGDIGRRADKILRSPEPFPQSDYIISESTYGDKLHTPEPDVKAHLLRIVRKTCVENAGKLIIPAFSVDRTQELIYALDVLSSEGKLPKIPVYIDSPLSVKATMVMRNHEEEFNEEILDYIKKDGDAFGFDNLNYITKVEDSKAINNYKTPCVIISASGMAEAGRIKHHIKNNCEDSRNTILIVGYCSPSSLGYQIKNKAEKIRVFGEDLELNANVEVMDSFSAHGDYEEIIDYLKCQEASKVKTLFLVHGEIETQRIFKDKLHAEGFNNVEIPSQGQGFEL